MVKEPSVFELLRFDYSKNSLTPTPKARLPWLSSNFKLIFDSLGNSSDGSRIKKQIFRDIFGIFLFYHENVSYVYSLESPYRGDSNETPLNFPHLPTHPAL